MKILIVDDEQNLLDMVISTIAWTSLGVTQVDTALEGRSALERIQAEKPDIVITDIEMPGMDGMELARQIHSRIPYPPEIIFLTCHADFSYAQEALQIGAANYLLKPFAPEELTAVLSKTIIRCMEKQRSRQLHEQLESLEGSRDYVARSFLRDLLDHSFEGPLESIVREAKRRNVSLDFGARCRMVAVGTNVDEHLKNYTKSQLLFIFRNIITEVMYGLEQPVGSYMVEYLGRSHFTAYLFLREELYTRQAVENRCARLVEVLKQYLGFHTLCVISEVVSADELARTRDRMDAMIFYNVSRGSGVTYLEDSGSTSALPETKINQQEIVVFLRERKKSELFLYMRHFLEQNEAQLNAQEMKLIHHDLMQVFYGYLYENNLSTHDFMRDSVSQTIQANAEFSSINMMKYVSYMYDCAVQCIDQARKSDTVIEKAKRYIEEHYMENIGRSEIAEAVMLAPNYLSMLFHRETGQTIREYINLCRIEAAKRIMVSTQNSITDIALQVGFDNISYFSTIFKKYTNLSPGEYRHRLETDPQIRKAETSE